VQVPPLQVPGDTQPLRTFPMQVAAGGDAQVTFWHGSPRHTPFAQPLAHVSVREV
jgi:hypothetical protein